MEQLADDSKHIMCKFNLSESYFKWGLNTPLCKLNVQIAVKSFSLICTPIIAAIKKGKIKWTWNSLGIWQSHTIFEIANSHVCTAGSKD